MPGVTRLARPKINLVLDVGPPDTAGMHPIASWFHSVAADLADTVTVSPADETSVRVAWAPDAPRAAPIDWPIDADLAARAHRLLEHHLRRALPARVEVAKRIPVGAGLGGGSADAAATLVALDQALGLGLGPARLRDLGAVLGSDVPFFIDDADPPRPAIVTGLGDHIERLAPRHDPVLLIVPPCACPTGEVYRAYDRLGPHPLDEPRVRDLAAGDLDAATLYNDLAPAAEHVRPLVRAVREAAALAIGAPVHVTGSGSALFALAGPHEAGRVTDALAPVAPGTLVIATRLDG
jgi:4-diphosphocytidyl-2-C-methyl-D-erythritol kinase